VLAGPLPDADTTAAKPEAAPRSLLAQSSFGDLCRLGLALTWPLVVVALLTSIALLLILLRH
jgi:hypothetical protein